MSRSSHGRPASVLEIRGRITRRTFIVGAAVAACRNGVDVAGPGEVARGGSPFVHGVASGDPLADRVILWTRITAEGRDPIPVTWIVAADPELTRVAARGATTAIAAHDFTVKVDAGGLRPGTAYHYRFEALGHASPTGRTKTLPVGTVSHLRLAFTSCSNYPAGYFNVYAAIAARDDLDLVLHLGDYIYEYGEGQYGVGELLDRAPDPVHETLTLADYRLRHAIYKRDPDLQAAHARHPFVTVWDDHESANDSCVESASNHTPDEGQWAVRKRAAIQAYLEWMPIRDPSNGGIARSFRFGDLADLVMLDTRLAGRDVQVDRADPTATADPRRSLLGRAQEDWLAQQLVRSRDDGVAWRLVGQQIPMGQLRTEESQPWSSDMWDGYDAARRRFLDHLDAEAIRDVVVMTGDIHSSWAMELCRDPFSADARERQPLAVELITPAVSSPSPIPADEVDGVVELLMRTHPHIGWVELEHRGYVDVDLDPERLRARWMHVSTVAERDATTRVAHELEVRRGEPRLRPRARPE